MNNLIIKELYRASLFCKMSYYSSSQLDELIEEPDNIYEDIYKIIKNNNLSYYEDASIKYYMFKYNNTIFIVFNSSLQYYSSKQLVKYKDNICIHKGLLQQFYSIEDRIHTTINDLNKSKLIKKIYITGYYIGGSLASVASAILAEKYKNMFLIHCFTFGAMMAGNCAFKRYFKDNVSNNYRVIINNCPQTGVNALEFYNCYSYYKYKYETYNKFYNGKYCHVHNALQLTNDNLLEIKKPKLNKRSRIFRYFYNTHHVDYQIKDMDEYILKLQSIITVYKENLAKQMLLLKSNIIKMTNENVLEVPSDSPNVPDVPNVPSQSSSGSKISIDDSVHRHSQNAYQLSREDIAYLDTRLQHITNKLSKILANHKMSYT